MPQHPFFLLRRLDEASRASACRILAAGRMEEEKFVPFTDFASREKGRVVTRYMPPGFDTVAAAAAGVEDRALSPNVKVVLWLLFDGLNDMFELGICPESLTAENIKIGSVSLEPKFVDLEFRHKTADRVQTILKSLAKLIQKQLLPKKAQGRSYLAGEVRHLLKIMKSQAVAMFPLIRFHPSLLPMENRTEYFSRMMTYVRDILRKVNTEGYEYVMNNINDQDHDWKTKLFTNSHLLRFYRSPRPSWYLPQTPLTTTQGTTQGNVIRTQGTLIPISEGARFHRNMPKHGLEASAHAGRPHGMLFSRTDMGFMLYAIMSMMLCAMAMSLQRINQFEHLDLHTLFPGRVVSTQKKS